MTSLGQLQYETLRVVSSHAASGKVDYRLRSLSGPMSAGTWTDLSEVCVGVLSSSGIVSRSSTEVKNGEAMSPFPPHVFLYCD